MRHVEFGTLSCSLWRFDLVFVILMTFSLWNCKIYVECDVSAENEGHSMVVYPYDVSPSKDKKHLAFKIRIDNTQVLQFTLHTSKKAFQNNDNCVMEGFVYKNGYFPVTIATCDGLSGTVFPNASSVLILKSMLEVGPTVTWNMLSQQAHLLTWYDGSADGSIPELFEELYPHEMVPEKSQKLRRRATPKHAVLTLINRANTVVHLYYMQPQTSQRQYFTRLRKNEKNLLRTYIGTTWLAYDEEEQPLLLNNKYNMLVFPKHTDQNVDVLITSKRKSHTTADRLKNLPKIKPKYLEVIVVGDPSFVKKHSSKKKAERYIKAIIKMVNLLFRHESLNISFHVVVNKIILLDDKDSKIKIDREQPKGSLTNVCKFMYDEKKKNKVNFDFGIFFTRRRFGYSGFTPLFRMCVPYKSCTLIFDSGLQSSFVMAHEIGHGIGLSHDGEHNECLNDTTRGSVMAPTIYSRFGNYHWSNCTRAQIRENLDYFPCLKNKPKNFEFNETDLPGATFDIEDQCRHYWGKGYTSCFGVRDPQQHCAYTFCRIPNRKLSQCAYHTTPPVDGTKCGKDKWCVNKNCVPVGRLIPEAIDGSWSDWSAWTSCSGRCGQGVRFRNRRCDKPLPFFGGKECNGTNKEWELCYRRRCSVTHTFADQRYDACYQSFGKGWKWLSEEDNKMKVESLDLDCSFENGLNGWVNSNNTKTQWKLGSGSTATPKTGPTADHTLQNENGTYLYLESSYPTSKGDTAILISPKLLVPILCLRFYYHMYGERVGNLRVLRVTEGVDEPLELWSMSGSKGSGWLKSFVDISNEKEYQIAIEVERAKTYLSDIAVDDIKITPGSCRKNEHDKCRFTCYNYEQQEFKINKVVPDGMKCEKDRTNICVDSRCETIGCDNLVDSDFKYDVCGVCGGDNSTCSYQQITVKVTPEKLTQSILLIPKGFYKFTATKVTPSEARIAVHHVSQRTTHYYDHDPLSTYRWYYFPVHNTTFRYESVINNTENLFIDGVVNTDMQLQLIFPGPLLNKTEEITVTYSVYIPTSNATNTTRGSTTTNTTEENYFTWKLIDWTACTETCNGGNTTAIYKCIKLRTNVTVDATNCSPENVEVLKRTIACNTQICNVNHVYVTGKWQKCPICGRVGERKRNITCTQVKEGEKPVIVDMKECSSLRNTPSATQKCFRYCPRKKLRCVERSKACAGLVQKGYCKYDSVKDLCCESCELSIK